MRSGSAPILAGQFIWYKERVMKRLAQGQSHVPTQSPKQVQFEHAAVKTNSKGNKESDKEITENDVQDETMYELGEPEWAE